jgi:hypothetical protein
VVVEDITEMVTVLAELEDISEVEAVVVKDITELVA